MSIPNSMRVIILLLGFAAPVRASTWSIGACAGFDIVTAGAGSSVLVLGAPVGNVVVSEYSELPGAIRDKNIIVGVIAVPAIAAQSAADDLVAAGVKIVFNYSEALLETPADVTVHTSNPAVELLYALYFHLT